MLTSIRVDDINQLQRQLHADRVAHGEATERVLSIVKGICDDVTTRLEEVQERMDTTDTQLEHAFDHLEPIISRLIRLAGKYEPEEANELEADFNRGAEATSLEYVETAASYVPEYEGDQSVLCEVAPSI